MDTHLIILHLHLVKLPSPLPCLPYLLVSAPVAADKPAVAAADTSAAAAAERTSAVDPDRLAAALDKQAAVGDRKVPTNTPVNNYSSAEEDHQEVARNVVVRGTSIAILEDLGSC